MLLSPFQKFESADLSIDQKLICQPVIHFFLCGGMNSCNAHSAMQMSSAVFPNNIFNDFLLMSFFFLYINI